MSNFYEGLIRGGVERQKEKMSENTVVKREAKEISLKQKTRFVSNILNQKPEDNLLDDFHLYLNTISTRSSFLRSYNIIRGIRKRLEKDSELLELSISDLKDFNERFNHCSICFLNSLERGERKGFDLGDMVKSVWCEDTPIFNQNLGKNAETYEIMERNGVYPIGSYGFIVNFDRFGVYVQIVSDKIEGWKNKWNFIKDHSSKGFDKVAFYVPQELEIVPPNFFLLREFRKELDFVCDRLTTEIKNKRNKRR